MFDEALQQEGFVIDSDQKAEWAVKKIAEIKCERDRLDDICQKQIDFYATKQLECKQKYENDRGGLVMMLAQYFESVPAKSTKTQAAYKLISGKLVKKFEKQEFKHNPDTLLELLKDTEYVEQKPSLKWGEYKKTLQIIDGRVVDKDGEIVEGVTVEIKPASFDVEV